MSVPLCRAPVLIRDGIGNCTRSLYNFVESSISVISLKTERHSLVSSAPSPILMHRFFCRCSISPMARLKRTTLTDPRRLFFQTVFCVASFPMVKNKILMPLRCRKLFSLLNRSPSLLSDLATVLARTRLRSETGFGTWFTSFLGPNSRIKVPPLRY